MELSLIDKNITRLSFDEDSYIATLEDRSIETQKLPKNLTILDCSHNPLISLSNLPEGIITLRCCYCLLRDLPTLPRSLKKLNVSHNRLRGLVGLVNLDLERLICHGNPLWFISLPKVRPKYVSVPENLRFLFSELSTLPNHPKLC